MNSLMHTENRIEILYSFYKDYYSTSSSEDNIFSDSSVQQYLEGILNTVHDRTSINYSPNEKDSDSRISEELFLPLVERVLAKNNVIIEQKRYNSLISTLSRKLESLLNIYPFETDIETRCEDFIIEIEHKYSFNILGGVIQTIYTNNYDKPSYLIGICNALLRYDLEEVKPWGSVILSGLINHPNETVKEYVVQLIDNWNDKSLLPMLKTIDISSEWLREYVNDVIKKIG